MGYTIREKVDIVLTYGESQRCLQKTTRLYAKKFPHRVCPPCHVISNVVKHFRQTGNVDGKELAVKRNARKSVCHRRKTVINKGKTRRSPGAVLQVSEFPITGTNKLYYVQIENYVCTTFRLKKNLFRPYHV